MGKGVYGENKNLAVRQSRASVKILVVHIFKVRWYHEGTLRPNEGYACFFDI